MYYIQDKEGCYFCGAVLSIPVWSDDIRDAKFYASNNDMAFDEKVLIDRDVLYFVLMREVA